ncbi:MAG: energy-coupling factor transporter transmembrane component T [Anaerolineales bacterium]|jgi:energy-coupling factor transporter transmembrane protein EcfT
MTGAMHQAEIGTIGRLAIFIGLVFASIQLTGAGLAVVLAIMLAVGLIAYRPAMKRLLRWRWLIFFAVLVLPNALWNGEADSRLGGLAYSSEGLQTGLAMAMRAGIMLGVVMWFTGSVDISEVAGLLERAGLKGLGFSMGVAVNLLPSLMQSFRSAWHTLQMRGGIRRLRLRAIRLLLVTVFSNALRRADEITLVAEARAFSPQRPRSLPVRKGRFDLPVVVASLVTIIALGLLT